MITKFTTSSISNKINYDSMLAGNLPFSPGAYEQIATQVLTGTSASVVFSSIAQTYRHLQLRIVPLGTGSGALLVRFNGDAGANYATHRLQGYNGAVNSGGATGGTGVQWNFNRDVPAANPYPAIVDLLDYTNTNIVKTARVLSGLANGAGTASEVLLNSARWNNTAAISSITVAFTSFTTGSRFSLYGIKG